MNKSEQPIEIAQPRVVEHAVRLLYPFRFNPDSVAEVEANLIKPLLALPYQAVAGALPLPPRVQPSSDPADTLGAALVWERANHPNIGGDLYPHIRQILGGTGTPDRPAPATQTAPDQPRIDASAPSARLIAAPTLQVRKEVIHGLSGARGKAGPGLAVQLSQSALRRLRQAGACTEEQRQAKTPLCLTLNEITLHLFGTGIGVVCVIVEYQALLNDREKRRLHPRILVEGTYACSRTGSMAQKGGPLRWVLPPTGKDAPQTLAEGETTLDTIVKTVLPVLAPGTNEHFCQRGDWERIFCYTAVLLDQPMPDEESRNLLAWRLSRKYTDDYAPSPAITAHSTLRPFATVCHSLDLEGGCVLVERPAGADGTDAPEFLNNFLNTAIRTAYWPLTLLAYQEYEALLRMSSDWGGTIEKYTHPTQQEIDQLEAHQARLLCFRQHFRFTHVSRISMHNQVYERWRQALALDKMLEEVSRDVEEISGFLARCAVVQQARRDQSQKRAWTRLNVKQTSVGILATALLFATGFFGMNFEEFTDGGMKIADPYSWIMVFLAGVFSISLLFISFYERQANKILKEENQKP